MYCQVGEWEDKAMSDFSREDLAADVLPEVFERTEMDHFENAIRRVGVGSACEYFGHEWDSDFAKETVHWLKERYEASFK